MAVVIQIRRDISSTWTSLNPTLEDGEIGFEKDTYKIKVGDGTTNWNTLTYFDGGGGGGGSSISSGASAGTNTYTVSVSPALVSLTTYTLILVRITNTSTGLSTLNPSALGAKKILKNPTEQAGANDLVADTIYLMMYDGTADAGAGAWIPLNLFNEVSNGISNTLNKIELGGPLTKNTTISGNFNLILDTLSEFKAKATNLNFESSNIDLGVSGTPTLKLGGNLAPNPTDYLAGDGTWKSAATFTGFTIGKNGSNETVGFNFNIATTQYLANGRVGYIRLNQSNGSLEFYTNITTGVAGDAVSGSINMGLSELGNLGIGGAPSATTKLLLPASTTSISSLRISHGSAPTSPVNGDFWTTTANPFIRINGVTRTIASLEGPTFTGVPSAPTASSGTSTTQLATTAFVINELADHTDPDDALIGAIGTPIKAQPYGYKFSSSNNNMTLSDGQLRSVLVYLPKAATITGVKFIQKTQGSYTADNNNRVALYSYSAGALTQVAASNNDGDLWKGSSNTLVSVPFASTYNAAAGVYVIMILYNSSAQTTAPQIAGSGVLSDNLYSSMDFANSAKLWGFINTQTNLPASINMSGINTSSNVIWLALY